MIDYDISDHRSSISGYMNPNTMQNFAHWVHKVTENFRSQNYPTTLFAHKGSGLSLATALHVLYPGDYQILWTNHINIPQTDPYDILADDPELEMCSDIPEIDDLIFIDDALHSGDTLALFKRFHEVYTPSVKAIVCVMDTTHPKYYYEEQYGFEVKVCSNQTD